jgi:uncharacterized Zn finger protein
MRKKYYQCPICKFEWYLCYRYVAPKREGERDFLTRCSNCGYIFSEEEEKNET